MNEARYKYGKRHDPSVPDATIELWAYRNYEDTDRKIPKSDHMLNAIRLLWPEEMPNGKRGHIITKWTERRVRAWCEKTFKEGDQDFQTWWGPSSVGKSADAAVIVLVHWLSAPDKTSVTICSTTGAMLMKRIWSDLLKYHRMVPGLPGEWRSTKFAILLGDDNSRNGIFGIAVQKGTIEEAVGNIVGVHNEYNVLVIDEMQATKQAAVDAFDNLSTGKEAKFLGMGNPIRRLDPLGIASKPKAGWNSVSAKTHEEWQTAKGKCLFFDGLKSPGVDDPAKYWFLLTQKQIDSMRVDPGEDSPRFWSQRRGFVAPEGLCQTVFTENFIIQHNMQQVPEWSGMPIMIAGHDPAFTTGGDDAILYPIKIGIMTNGFIGIHFMKQEKIFMRVSADVPLEFDMARQVIARCKDLGISARNLGVDVTAQQTAYASILDKEWGEHVTRVQCAGSASERRISDDPSDERIARDVYHNKVTELWYQFREFGLHDQIFGLSDEAVIELCSRLLDNSKARLAVESKDEMRLRSGVSPNIADAACIGLEVAAMLYGAKPGSTRPLSDMPENEAMSDEQYREFDLDDEEKTYLTDGVDVM